MGAAGITSSTSEMSARGIEKNGTGGIMIDLDLIPAREEEPSERLQKCAAILNVQFLHHQKLLGSSDAQESHG